MGFTGGTYTPPSNSWYPADSGVAATASDWNTTLNDIAANGLSKCTLRDGSVPFSGSVLITDGSVTTPGIAFNSESNSGLYRVTAGELGITVSGLQAGFFSTAGLTTIGLNIESGPLELNGSAGTAGQILRSNGAAALPSWENNLPALVQNEGSLGTGTTTIDWSVGDIVQITLTGSALTLAFSNPPASGFAQTLTIVFIQDATGSRTLPAFSSTIKWDGGVTPVLTTTANKTDMLQIMAVNVAGSVTYYGCQIFGNG